MAGLRLLGAANDPNSLDFSYRLEPDYDTADRTAFVLSVDPVARPDTTDLERLAGWSPDVAVPTGAQLVRASVSFEPSTATQLVLGLHIEYLLAGGDAAQLAADTAASLGLTDWKLTDRSGNSVGETFELEPLPGLASRKLRISSTNTGAEFHIDGSRQVPY